MAVLPVVLMCQVSICNFQMIIRGLIHVACCEYYYFIFFCNRLVVFFAATKRAQTSSDRGTARSSRPSCLTDVFHRRSRREPKTTAYANNTPVPNLCLCKHTISHLTGAPQGEDHHTHTQVHRNLSHLPCKCSSITAWSPHLTPDQKLD